MKKSLIIKIIVVLALIGLVIYFRDYINVDFLESVSDNPFAPLIFIVIYSVAVTFALPASAFTLISAPLFGFWQGLLFTVMASNLGCHFSYFLAKILGKDVIMKKIKDVSFLNKATEKASDNWFIFMMYARLIPLFPFAAVNYISGVLGVPYKYYTVATVLGMLPGSAVYVYLGYSATNVKENPLGLIVSIAVLVLFTLIVTFIKKKKKL